MDRRKEDEKKKEKRNKWLAFGRNFGQQFFSFSSSCFGWPKFCFGLHILALIHCRRRRRGRQSAHLTQFKTGFLGQ